MVDGIPEAISDCCRYVPSPVLPGSPALLLLKIRSHYQNCSIVPDHSEGSKVFTSLAQNNETFPTVSWTKDEGIRHSAFVDYTKKRNEGGKNPRWKVWFVTLFWDTDRFFFPTHPSTLCYAGMRCSRKATGKCPERQPGLLHSWRTLIPVRDCLADWWLAEKEGSQAKGFNPLLCLSYVSHAQAGQNNPSVSQNRGKRDRIKIGNWGSKFHACVVFFNLGTDGEQFNSAMGKGPTYCLELQKQKFWRIKCDGYNVRKIYKAILEGTKEKKNTNMLNPLLAWTF